MTLKDDTIFISIASYRDPDLINTVTNCWENATDKNSLFFSIVSQAEEDEHPNLSFVPSNQLRYTKVHWKESKGACWAREIASREIHTKYFLQIDSHSRFKNDWDLTLKTYFVYCQKYCWGKRIVFSNYPNSFTRNWDEEKDYLVDWDTFYRLRAEWDDAAKMVVPRWESCEPTEFGYEVFFVSANNLFCESEIIKEVPYDSNLYFTGEEPSLALRFYTRGIKTINTPVKFMYTNYDRDNGKRNLHWTDHQEWWKLNSESYKRLSLIMTGNTDLGVYGIGSKELFKEYQERTGISLEDKKEVIWSA